MKIAWGFLAVAVGVLATTGARAVGVSSPPVSLVRVPHGGLQPEVAVDDHGVVHMVYFSGEASGGNLYYVRSTDFGSTFSPPIRINSQDGSAIATGTIRGGQLAVGRAGRVYVVWNGSDTAVPRGLNNPTIRQPSAPFLYSRSNAAGAAFEPQRNLTQRSYGVDGGGSIAADAAGHVYAAWHALESGGATGEDHRRVWIARSSDDGATFSAEDPAWVDTTGACDCCALRLIAAPINQLYLLYRSAMSLTHRDIYLLESTDQGRSFRGSNVQGWTIGACPMTSMSLVTSGRRVLGAWETAGQVYFGEVLTDSARIPAFTPAPGAAPNRKHPRLAANANGDVLMVWTEGTAWARGGSLAWQIFDRSGNARGSTGTAAPVPVWSFAAAFARPDGRFMIVY